MIGRPQSVTYDRLRVTITNRPLDSHDNLELDKHRVVLLRSGGYLLTRTGPSDLPRRVGFGDTLAVEAHLAQTLKVC